MNEEPIRPHIRDALSKVYAAVRAANLGHEDATEVFIRSLISVALDIVNGDNEKGARYLEQVVVATVIDMAGDLRERGGNTTPEIEHGGSLH